MQKKNPKRISARMRGAACNCVNLKGRLCLLRGHSQPVRYAAEQFNSRGREFLLVF